MELGVSHYFSCKNMVKSDQILGECPPTKTIYKTTMQLAWPSAIERVLVSLVSAIDTMMVGGLGAGAIAAIGMTQIGRASCRERVYVLV